MIDFAIQFLKPLKIAVLLTLLFAFWGLNRKNEVHRYLLFILVICFSTELMNSALIVNAKSIVLSSTLSICLHHTLWLVLLSKFVSFIKVAYLLIISFILFAAINLFFFEGVESFNYYTFVVGAFIYLVIFIYQSFYKLKAEDFPFFLSNNYLLLSAPILFFFGLSFMFGFKTSKITSFIIFDDVKLYTFIIYFVNVVYYTLINIYIYREKRLINV